MAHVDRSKITKPLVMLHGLEALGIILLVPTGVVYANQTGGEACRQPSEEGAYVPLERYGPRGAGDHVSLSDRLCARFRASRSSEFELESQDADAIDALLAQGGMMTEILSVDRSRLRESHDSWVYVNVGRHPDRHPPYPIHSRTKLYWLYGFGATRGVLTW